MKYLSIYENFKNIQCYYWKIETKDPNFWIALKKIGMPESMQQIIKTEWKMWIDNVKKEFSFCYISKSKMMSKNEYRAWEGYSPTTENIKFLNSNVGKNMGEIKITQFDIDSSKFGL